ncbi:ASKHA domain-containing protein [bacterium BMS3Abin03]|nr:ASKHA domain-containing protein [bacterium BMS3Abin03]
MSVELYFNNKKSLVLPGSRLHEYGEAIGIRVPTSCNRQGKCKECIVEVTEGMELLSSPTDKESHLKDNFRLSCQCKIIADSGVLRCNTMRRGSLRIEKKALHLSVLDNKFEIDPAVTRDGDKILLDGIEIEKSNAPIHGVAVDLGTTTVVVRLFNLETGELIADTSFENPQRFGGSDVMARIHYDTINKGKVLQRTLAGYLSHAIEDFPVDPKTIYEVVIAGNSTMRDLFFRLDVYSIGQNPYRSITEIEKGEGKRTTTSISDSIKKIKLPVHPKARVYGLPIISGHVGADAAACMLAVNIANEDRLIAIMDIGTNTELILGNKNKILAASCPAGPAFEGGNISCGMPGFRGAIEKIMLDKKGSFEYKVIEETKPEGICGSGLIDLLSELLKNDRMNYLGRFKHEEQKINIYSNGSSQVYINEKDVNELAQAKGANVAGLYTVFKNYGVKFNDVDVFYLAGGFGRHINIESAKRIGLIPNIDESKILQVGNASIEGASIGLLSKTKRKELEELVNKVTHCRLETDPDFFNHFVEGCQFNPVETLSDEMNIKD